MASDQRHLIGCSRHHFRMTSAFDGLYLPTLALSHSYSEEEHGLVLVFTGIQSENLKSYSVMFWRWWRRQYSAMFLWRWWRRRREKRPIIANTGLQESPSLFNGEVRTGAQGQWGKGLGTRKVLDVGTIRILMDTYIHTDLHLELTHFLANLGNLGGRVLPIRCL